MDVLGFVGHSFSPEDETVCRKICDYLDSITKMHPNFTFETARSAAPKELATKVREILDKKNLFIGICTKQQMSIRNKLRKIFNYYLIKPTDITWKCSDWIMQEAAYSLGQDKVIILLVEEGVIVPTIFGINLEYIQFNRNNPDECFKPLLEMITSLVPKLKRVDDANLVISKDSEEQKTTLMPNKPRDQWTQDDYSIALIYTGIIKKDKAEIDTLMAQFQEKFSEKEYEFFLAESLFFKIMYLREDNLEQLIQLHNKYPDSNNICSYLAQIYESFGDKEKVLYYLNKITKSSELDSLEVFYSECDLVLKKFEYHESDARESMENLLLVYTSSHSNDEKVKIKLLNCLIEISKITGNKNDLAAFSELYLAINPLNYDERFNLALSYSSWEIPNLSLLELPPLNRTTYFPFAALKN